MKHIPMREDANFMEATDSLNLQWMNKRFFPDIFKYYELEGPFCTLGFNVIVFSLGSGRDA